MKRGLNTVQFVQRSRKVRESGSPKEACINFLPNFTDFRAKTKFRYLK